MSNFYYYCCNDCKHFEKRESRVCLMCPSCEIEMTEVEPPSDEELHDLFNEHLIDCLDPVKIGSLEYCVADAFKTLDPVAYRCGFNDWLDNEISAGKLVELDGHIFYAFN